MYNDKVLFFAYVYFLFDIFFTKLSVPILLTNTYSIVSRHYVSAALVFSAFIF